jgi:hypothetical protein
LICGVTASSGGNWASRGVFELDDVVAELRLHRLLRHLALLQLGHGGAELGHVGVGLGEVEVAAVLGRARVLRVLLGHVSNLAPPLICAISFFASSSFSTRMWRARYSVPVDCALNLSYSAWTRRR